MNEWVSRLTVLLRELTGEEVSVESAAPGREPQFGPSTLWWKAFSGQPPEPVWIGMEADAATVVLEKTSKASVSSDALKTEYGKLLERLDEKGEIVDQGPQGSIADAFEIRWPGIEPLRLYIAVSNSGNWSNLEVLKDIELPVTLRFGTTRMTLQDLTGLSTGSVIEFDGGLHDPVEVLVNGRVIARGEAVIVQDSYAVRISEIASPPDRITFQGEAPGSSS